jgi:hypothetical protein
MLRVQCYGEGEWVRVIVTVLNRKATRGLRARRVARALVLTKGSGGHTAKGLVRKTCAHTLLSAGWGPVHVKVNST